MDDEIALQPEGRRSIVIGGFTKNSEDPFLHKNVNVIGTVELIDQVLRNKNVAIGSCKECGEISVWQEL